MAEIILIRPKYTEITSHLKESRPPTGLLYVATWERMHDLLKQMGKENIEIIDRDLGFELCRREGIKAIVLGSFIKAGDMFATDVKVLDVDTKRLLKSASSKGKGADSILESQIDALSREVSQGIGIPEKKIEVAQIKVENFTTNSIEAYNYYLRGIEELVKLYYDIARQYLEKAVELDPSFARAYVGLAECFLILASDAYEPYEKSIPKAELAVKKALKLDPELAEAIAALARIHFAVDDIVACEAEGRRAIELNPSLPEAYRILSNVAFLKGSGEEGTRLWEAAYNLDPVRPRYVERLGSWYFYTGRESEALQFWEKTAELAPAGTYRNLTEYHMFKGNQEKAKEYFLMAEKLEPTDSWVPWMRGFIAARMGERNAALEAIRRIEENWSGALDLNGIGFIYYALGDLDSYFTYMNRAAEQHVLNYVYPMYCPLFAQGRTDPRHQGLLGKIREMMKPETKSSLASASDS